MTTHQSSCMTFTLFILPSPRLSPFTRICLTLSFLPHCTRHFFVSFYVLPRLPSPLSSQWDSPPSLLTRPNMVLSPIPVSLYLFLSPSYLFFLSFPPPCLPLHLPLPPSLATSLAQFLLSIYVHNRVQLWLIMAISFLTGDFQRWLEDACFLECISNVCVSVCVCVCAVLL